MLSRLLPALAFTVMSAALAADAPPSNLEDAEIDSSGDVWAFSRSGNNQLFLFDGTKWSVAPVPFLTGRDPRPFGLGRFEDGSVGCLWRLSNQTIAVSRHEARQSHLLLTSPGDIPEIGQLYKPVGDSHGRLWITGIQPRILWTDVKGASHIVHELTDSDMCAPLRKGITFNPLNIAEDGSGRVWISSDARASNYASINGVFIYDGQKIERRVPDGMDRKPLGPIVRKDARHMWMAMRNDGLYEVDIETLAPRRIDDPAEKALCCIRNMLAHENDLYVVTGHEGRSAVWKLSEGKWTCLLGDIERSPEKRPLLLHGRTLIAVAAGAPWVFQPDQAPERLDWRSDFPVEDVRTIFFLPDGRLFALGRGGPFCGKLDLHRPDTRIEEFFVRLGWAFDRSGNVWCVEGPDKNILKQWDGRQWLKHPFPEGSTEAPFAKLLVDEDGRVWLLPRSEDGPTLVFESPERKWLSFANPHEAFQSFLSRPVRFIEPGGRMRGFPSYRALYAGDRIAYRSTNNRIHFFDGSKWHVFIRKDITPEGGGPTGPPFFDAARRLCVNIGDVTWMREEDGKWLQTVRDASHPDEFSGSTTDSRSGVTLTTRSASREIELPDGARADSPTAVVIDNRGTYWFPAQKILYKAVPGARARVFPEGQPNPFLSGRVLNEVFVHPSGETFIETVSAGGSWFMLHPKTPPVTLNVTVAKIDDTSWRARLGESPRPGLKVTWQLDDGAWQELEGDNVLLEGLPNGKHVIRMQAMDEDLQRSPVAWSEFETFVDFDRQAAALISKLSDPDYENREAAMKALLRQPGAALPALQKARESAAADLRWWLDAAIQEIEDKNSRGK